MEEKVLINHRKRKICLIFCGGTIAMSRNPETRALEPTKSPEELLELVPEVKNYVDLDIVFLFNVDSSDMDSTHWTKIAIAIYERYNDYDGFLITHGTDTMADTASALAFTFGNNLNKPIVLTGAQAPPDAIGTDAKFNLANAFRAVTSNVAEVMISFGHFIFRGCRTQKRHESDFNAFMSPAFPELADVRTNIKWSHFARKIRKYGNPNLNFRPNFKESVLNVRLNAGLTPEMINILLSSGKITGLIFESLGAANVPANYIPTIKESVEKNIPVIVTSPFVGGSTSVMGAYKGGFDALRAGAIPSGDMTFPAAAAKLMWVLAQIEEKLKSKEMSQSDIVSYTRNIFGRDLVGEMTATEL